MQKLTKTLTTTPSSLRFFGHAIREIKTFAPNSSFPFIYGEIVTEDPKKDYRILGESPFSKTAVLAKQLSETDIHALQLIESKGKTLTIGILAGDVDQQTLLHYSKHLNSEIVAIQPDQTAKFPFEINEPVIVELEHNIIIAVTKLTDTDESSYRFD